MASVLPELRARRAVRAARARRSYPASAARDPVAPLEAPTDDRAQPHRPRGQAAGSMARRLLGPQVLVGAEPHPTGRPGAATADLRGPWARLAGGAAPGLA